MAIGSLIKRFFFGNELPQEYIGVPSDLPKGPRLHLIDSGEKDITDEHVLLGYKPLVIGSGLDLGARPTVEVRQGEDVLAKMIFERREKLSSLNIYVGIKAELSLTKKWDRFWVGIREKIKDKGRSNIDLDPNLYQQVIAAYAFPRIISLFVVRRSGQYNEFPTDLHGAHSEGRYASSLRIGGAACEQLMEADSIALYQMSLDQLRATYEKGGNHVRPWRSGDPSEDSTTFNKSGDPIGAVSCTELEVAGYLDIGIHRVFDYRVMKTSQCGSDSAVLAHCHRAYVQWRFKNGIPTEYRLR